MGNCLNLLSSDDPPHSPPSPCIASKMKHLSSAAHPAIPLKQFTLGFPPILPFSTPSDLAALYELGAELGRGQFGIIRKCTSHASGAHFACKSISKLRLRSVHEIKDVVREINIMKRLSDHASPVGPETPQGCNVVQLHEVVEDSAFVHLIMELCSGGELFDRIARSKCYPEVQAALLMKRLLETLQFCHSLGIMHRDVKPENLLFVDDSDESPIKLADFGLALEFSPGQKFSGMAGSAYYMAPEVLQGEYSKEVDIWSTGVVMYVLLSGVPPFMGHTEQDIFDAIQECQLDLTSEPWHTISPSAKDLISQMLCVDVLSRCTPAQALKHPWIVCHTVNTSGLLSPPILCQNQCQDLASDRDAALTAEIPAPSFGDTLTLEEHENVQNSDALQTVVVVNLCEPMAPDLVQIDCAKSELSVLMEALVAALDKERLSLSESMVKVRLQFGWTCTLLTKSATEETLMVDMGQEKYLIAYDRLRKRLGWKVLKPQGFSCMNGRVRSVRHLRKIQPVF